MSTRQKLYMLTAVAVFLGLNVSAALIVGNSGFDSGISDTDTTFTQADPYNVWYYDQGDSWVWTAETDGGPLGAGDAFAEGPPSASYDKLLVQAVQDAPGVKYTGSYTLSFDYNRPDAQGDFVVIVWGANSGGTWSIPTTGKLTSGNDYGDAVNLGTQSYAVTAGWKSDSFSFDLGSTGYDTVIIGFRSDNTVDLGIDNVTVSGGSSQQTGYDVWAASWSNNIGAATNDFDNDGLNNLYEYAMDGNPTNGLAPTNLPVFSRLGNGFVYVHPKRSDDTNITYLVETTTNLLDSGSWTNERYTVIGTNVTGQTLDFVTNDVGTVESEKFIRLKIQH